MKKSIFMASAVAFFIFSPVHAECNDFEVSFINDSGGFDEIACLRSYKEAETKMKENADYVVRNQNSLSPTKIIAMNKGVAYSYPLRNNSSTLKIWQHPSDRHPQYKNTYIASHYEMDYLGTERIVIDGGHGMIKVNVNGFEGYTDLEYTDLVPDKFFRNNLPIQLGGSSLEEPFTVKPQYSYYEIVQNDKYKDLAFTYFMGYPKEDGNARSYTIYLCPAFDFLEPGTKYRSPDGINFYKDEKLVGKSYNYYQYLPLRTKSAISPDVLNKYIEKYSDSIMKGKGNAFKEAQEKYGVNSLLLFSLASHESAYGTSKIAKNKNNLFGWNAVDSSPGQSASTFESVEKCVLEQASINLRGYSDINDFRFFGNHIGNKGSGMNVMYASDPYWGMKIGGIMYRIDKSSKNFDGTLTDYNQAHLALINEFDVPVKKDGNTLFTTRYGEHYQKDFIVPVVEGKIQTPNAIVDGKVYSHKDADRKTQPAHDYDFAASRGDLEEKFLTPLNFKPQDSETPEVPEVIEKVEKENLVYLSSANFTENGLVIEGYSVVPNVIYDKPTHQVVIRDYNDEEHVFETQIIEEDFQNGDGNVYKKAKFAATIPYTDLVDGVLEVKTDDTTCFATGLLKNTNPKYSRQSYELENKEYTLFTNQINNYRFEISVNHKDVVEKINKPAVRNSLLSFDTITFENNLLNIVGQGGIYYTDYSNEQNISLVLSNGENVYTFDSKTNKCPIDYKPILGTEENLDYICFNLSADVSELPAGEYSVFIKLNNGEYIDVIELTNRNDREIPLKTSNVRKRVILVK